MNAPPPPVDLAGCTLADRARLRRHWRSLHQSGMNAEALRAWHEALNAAHALLARRRAARPAAIAYPPDLPVSAHKEELAALIARHPVVVVCGATGSGKSTQLPKICLELGRGLFGRIGHTQPRRLAARTLASRIAQELDTELGTVVGYKVRFRDRVQPETAIKLMTDGILLAEIQGDRWLNEYDTLIIDEAHERSLNIDFLLGYLQQLRTRRRDLKLIITSATIAPERFARHFAAADGTPAPIITIAGRTYPVETRYCPPEEENAGELDDAMQQAIAAALAELARAGPGDTLVFLSGEREIRVTAATLRQHHPPGTEILPLYARQGAAEQARIFQPHTARRVVLATNVAETSLTVPGIRYVIDPGFARISRYNPRTKVQRLVVERISQAAADQRRGRCGRLGPGICIRLYSAARFQTLKEFTEPEIQRAHLAAVILQMKWLGFGAIERFPFIDPPEHRLIADGYRTLKELAALDHQGQLTPLGRQLARLPVDPRLGRMLLAAAERHCLHEVTTIAAALSIQDPRERPLEQRQAADEIHATFHHPESDFLALLNLWAFLTRERARLSRRQFQELCRRHFLSWSRVQEWRDIRAQLHETLAELGYKENQVPADYEAIHRAVLTGLLDHVGMRDERDYRGTRNTRFAIHPSSGLFRAAPKWIMAAERVETARHYGRIVAKIHPEWIEAAAAHLVERSYFEPHWQASAGQVAAFERVTLYGLVLIPKRRINYGPINPAEAREIFLRSALVAGEFTTRAPFWRHNAALLESVRLMEAKTRRSDLLVDDEALYAFYAARVPEGIYSKPLFERWLRQATAAQPKLLHMRLSDVLRPEATVPDPAAFPDHLTVGATALPLVYRFAPGAADDGLTVTVPAALLQQLAPERLDWLVPGLLEARILALLRGLPKVLRKALLPLTATAAQLAARLAPRFAAEHGTLPPIERQPQPLTEVLSAEIAALTGVTVPATAWQETALPEHLRLKVRVVDEAGRTLAVSSDLAALRRAYGTAAASAFVHPLERRGLKRWDGPALPERVELVHGGIRLYGYPALVDEGTSVAVRVLDSENRAAAAMRAGLCRLFLLALAAEARTLRQSLSDLDRLRLQYAKVPERSESWMVRHADTHSAAIPDACEPRPPGDLVDELLALSIARTFLDDLPPLRAPEAFAARLAAHRARWPAVVRDTHVLVSTVLDLYHTLRLRLADLTQAAWQAAADDIRAQLDELVFRGFLQQIPYARLLHYPRYLKAALIRIDKLPAGRDHALRAKLHPLLVQWRERQCAVAAAGREDPRLEEVRWMLEELRVSLFAQQLGTAYPVSVERVQARWRALGL